MDNKHKQAIVDYLRFKGVTITDEQIPTLTLDAGESMSWSEWTQEDFSVRVIWDDGKQSYHMPEWEVIKFFNWLVGIRPDE